MKKQDDFYTILLEKFGHNPKTVGWSSLENQHIRFQILAKYSNWAGKHVLDVGCGLGDLYDLIKRENKNTQYTGIDELEPLIQQAKNAYPEGHFECVSLHDFPKEKKYDCVVVNGAFNFRQKEDQYVFLKRNVSELLELTSECLVITVLSGSEKIYDRLFYYDKEKTKAALQDLGELELVDDYIENDFAIIFRKKDV